MFRARVATLILSSFSLTAVALALPAAEKARPRLSAAEPVHDFGKVSMNTKLEYDFVLRNEGDAALHIATATPDCQCLTATFDREIAPHGEGRVHIAIVVPATPGALVALTTLATDDPDIPKATLTAQAIVVPKTAIQPETIRLIGVQHEPEARGGVTVWALDRDDFTVTAVESPGPNVRVTFHEAAGVEAADKGHGRQWRVEASVAPDAAVGAISGQIKVRTNHPTDSLLLIPVSGFLRPLIAVSPEDANLGDIDPTNYRKRLMLSYFGSDPLAPPTVESTVAGLRLEVETVAPGKRFNVWVTFDPAIAKGPIAGTIRIAASHAGLAPIEVPVSGTVK